MKVFILLGSDDYIARHILGVYATRELAQQAIDTEEHLLISRCGEPLREIVEQKLITEVK